MIFDFTLVLIYIAICVWKVLQLKTPIPPYMFFVFLFGMSIVYSFGNFLRKLFFDIKNMEKQEGDKENSKGEN